VAICGKGYVKCTIRVKDILVEAYSGYVQRDIQFFFLSYPFPKICLHVFERGEDCCLRRCRDCTTAIPGDRNVVASLLPKMAEMNINLIYHILKLIPTMSREQQLRGAET
jgi:hypothetical protein